jgi:dTDP-4-amino-4,6-dideoxygalactose transaminase
MLCRGARAGRLLAPEVRTFEREFADYCGCRHAIGVNSVAEQLAVEFLSVLQSKITVK